MKYKQSDPGTYGKKKREGRNGTGDLLLYP
jgi:hypothetical protein